MKKVFSTILVSFALLFLVSGVAQAWGPGCDAVTHKDPGQPTALGIVPCGVNVYSSTDTLPAGTAVGQLKCPCELGHFFIMARGIYIFALWYLALPLAGLLIVVGGVLIVASGANPGLLDRGKAILWGVGWALALMFGAWLLVNIVFTLLGYGGTWNQFTI